MTTVKLILNDGLARAVVYLIWAAAFSGGAYVQQLTADELPSGTAEVHLLINHQEGESR